MVLVEHRLRVGKVQGVFRDHVPRQFGHEFEVAARDLVVGGVGGHPRQSLQFPVDLLAHVVGQVDVAELLAQFGDVLVVAVFAERFLDDPLLLPKQVLPLAVLGLLARLGLQVALHLHDRQFLAQEAMDGFQERLDLVDLEDALLVVLLDVPRQLDEPVHLRHRVLDRPDHLLEELVGVLRHDVGDLARDVQVLADQCRGLGPILSVFREDRRRQFHHLDLGGRILGRRRTQRMDPERGGHRGR